MVRHTLKVLELVQALRIKGLIVYALLVNKIIYKWSHLYIET